MGEGDGATDGAADEAADEADDGAADGAAPAPRSAAEEARLVAAITDLFERRITFNGLLGFGVESFDGTRVRIGFDMRPELIGHFLHGRLHGGVISAALDVAGGLAVMRGIASYHAHESAPEVLQRFAHLGTIDLRVDYLRQGIGERFVAEAETVRLGRRIAASAMRLTNERDTLIATGNATYIVS